MSFFTTPTEDAGYYNVTPDTMLGLQGAYNFKPGTTPAATGFTEDTASTDTLAQLTRDQWEYYKQVGVPLENELFDSYRNPQLWNDTLDFSKQATKDAFGAMRGQNEREIGRYGVGMNTRQQGNFDRQSGLQEKSAQVRNTNSARKMLQERDDAVMTGQSSQVTLKDLNA